MRAGVHTALARVVSAFGEARAHHGYFSMNRWTSRTKALLQDGFALWLCARRLYQGRFIDARLAPSGHLLRAPEQLQAFIVGLPWERLEEYGSIRVL